MKNLFELRNISAVKDIIEELEKDISKAQSELEYVKTLEELHKVQGKLFYMRHILKQFTTEPKGRKDNE